LISLRIIRPIFILLILPLLAAGCNNYVAEKFIAAPNRNDITRGQDAPQSVLDEHHVAQQLRVNVGPPSASLEVWIVNSVTSPAYLSLTPGPGRFDDPIAKLTILPQTQPSPEGERPTKGTIFLLHGLRDSMEGVPYEFYSFGLACEGYRVILVDFRGHGRSTGDRISYGAYEAHDMVQVLDEMQRRGLIVGKVGIFGLSYGASIGICWAAIDPRIKVVVALEPFSTLRYAAEDAGKTMLMEFRWMFTESDYKDVVNRIDKILGINSDALSPLNAIAHTQTPILLIHGKEDTFLYPSHSIRLHKADPDHSQLILVDNTDHFDLWYKAIKMIMGEDNDWFDRYLTK
jgi:pimeloyl-ACP methyl ester carboxylesterase